MSTFLTDDRPSDLEKDQRHYRELDGANSGGYSRCAVCLGVIPEEHTWCTPCLLLVIEARQRTARAALALAAESEAANA